MEITEIKKVTKNARETRYTRIFVFPKGETIWDNLRFRKERPYTVYKKLLKPVFEQLGLPSNAKLAWSQRAGCSCPCSPGFFVKFADGRNASIKNEHGFPVDIFVTITE